MSRQHPLSAQAPRLSLDIVYLSIGECLFTNRPLLLSTVLGSCVGATLYHPATGHGAMFHAMLPDSNKARSQGKPCMFADGAVALLLERFARGGFRTGDLVVRLFGGAYTMPDMDPALGKALDVGRMNVEQARQALARGGAKVESEHVLGNRGRKIFLDVSTGRTWVTWVSDQVVEEFHKQ